MNSKPQNKKQAFLWNTIAASISSFQSFLILIVISHSGSQADAGILVFAIATANLMTMIGKFGMRQYQASDLSRQYSLGTYLRSRQITCLLMIVVSIGYALHASFGDRKKMLVIILWCAIRVIESYEDVYHGYLQSIDRLELASKIWGARNVLSIVFFCTTYLNTDNLVTASFVSCLSCLVTYFLFNLPFKSLYSAELGNTSDQETSSNMGLFASPWPLLWANFPLFASYFLQMYLSNAPRYAINGNLSDEMQAIYGYLIMPVFLISLFGNVMLQPLVTTYTRHWAGGNLKDFRKLILMHLSVISVLVVTFIIGGKLIGLHLLELVYNVDLKEYSLILYILLIAGGFQAIQSYFVTLLTVIRFHRLLIVGFSVASILLFVAGSSVVKSHGMLGISLYFLIILAALSIFFAGLLTYRLKKGPGPDAP